MYYEPPQPRENYGSQYYSSVQYPAVTFIATVFNVLAWIFVVGSVIGFLVLVNEDSDALLPSLLILVVGAFNFVLCKAISELLKVLTDISYSAREILIYLTRNE